MISFENEFKISGLARESSSMGYRKEKEPPGSWELLSKESHIG